MNTNYTHCIKCGVELTEENKYRTVKRYCKRCQNKFTKVARLKWEKTHPIKYKAQRMMTSIKDCKNYKHNIKRNDIALMVAKSLNTNCKYCSSKLTLKNMSIDHIIPKSRNGSCDITNLELICAKCNRRKASLTNVEFGLLLEFLNKQNKDFRNIVLARMAMAGMGYKRYGRK